MSPKKDNFKTIFHLPTIHVQGLCWFLGGVSLVIGFIQLYSPLPRLFGQKSRECKCSVVATWYIYSVTSGDPRIKTWWDLVFLVCFSGLFLPKVTILSNKIKVQSWKTSHRHSPISIGSRILYILCRPQTEKTSGSLTWWRQTAGNWFLVSCLNDLVLVISRFSAWLKLDIAPHIETDVVFSPRQPFHVFKWSHVHLSIHLLNHFKKRLYYFPLVISNSIQCCFSINIPRFHSSSIPFFSYFWVNANLNQIEGSHNWKPSLHPQPPSMSTLSSTDSWPVEKSVGQNYPHPETISKSTCKRVSSFGGEGGGVCC